jgi:carbamoyltransferase
MIILGISALYHDSAAAIVSNEKIIAAAQEERFSRIKHDKSYPINAINYCIKEAGINPQDIDYVCFYEKPLLKFSRIIHTHLVFSPFSIRTFIQSMHEWLTNKIFYKRNLIKILNKIDSKVNWKNKIIFSEHHLSHAASAFFPSPFKSSAILTMDGVGEWATTSLAVGNQNKIDILKEIHFPHSLGMLYSAFTAYAGFRVNSGEYKLMGLAPYGQPKYTKLIRDNLIDIKEDGSFRLDLSYFNFHIGSTMTNSKFHDLFNGEPREPETELSQKEMDIAASIQLITEEVVIKLAKNIKLVTNEENLCLAGGVALNCVANGKLHELNIFKNIWIQPAAGDAGGALGAALSALHLFKNIERYPNSDVQDSMQGSFLGPSFSNKEIKKSLDMLGAIYTEMNYEDIFDFCAEAVLEGKALGWHQGRMEFGPRALGARSIIGDPKSPSMQKILNLKVKYRESFRPFAPSILSEEASKWFEMNHDSPYMLFVRKVRDHHCFKTKEDNLFGIEKLNQIRSTIPSVTHIDYSARIQTVHKETNPIYHSLITRFKEISECPMVVNTSFNVRGEPIVNTPEDAFR